MNQLTNKTGLPEPIYHAIEEWSQEYDAGDTLSATTLISPPWIQKLKDEYVAERPPEDAVDLIYAFSGSFRHWMLEKAGKAMQRRSPEWAEKSVVEKRLYGKVDVGGKLYTVSAQLDLMEPDGTVTDYKEVGIYKMKQAKIGFPETSWIQQLNIQAWLLRVNGYDPTKLQICTLGRDWRKSESLHEKDYPMQAEMIPVELWDQKTQLDYIKKRIKLRIDVLEEGMEIPCTPDERWRQPTLYKVFRNKNKRACSGGVFLSMEPAKEFIHNQKKPQEYRVVEQIGGDRRCESYCNVNKFCKFNRMVK